jgi:long-chain acyl-CoA synthetase
MQGYYKAPGFTTEAFTEDGWFKTGDIGYLDQDNYLFITDRKKDLLKTAAGKFVAPQPIENALKASPFVLNAMVVGDQRKFVVALIVINAVTISAKLAEEELTFSSAAEMAAHPRTYALVQKEVQRLTPHLAQYETIKRFALLPDDFTFDTGMLTFTMKLKRRVVEHQYQSLIDKLFADVTEPRPLVRD